jgi:hypothetical protein
MKRAICIILVGVIAVCSIFAGGEVETEETVETVSLAEREFPPEISASTDTMLSGNTVMMMTLAPQFEVIIGSKLRAVPSGILQNECLAAKTGKADFWNVHMASAYRPAFGVEEYCVEAWGPQPIRIAWMGGPALLTMVVRETSDINTMADLKGQKIGVYAGAEGFVGACLAFANLTLDDVVVVPATGYTGAIGMLAENKVDSAFAATSAPGCYEMAEARDGLRFLEIPPTNKAGWKRLQKVYPALLPFSVPDGVGPEMAWGKEILGFNRGYFMFADADPLIAYGAAKVCHEGYEAYKDAHNELYSWTLEMALDCLMAPLPYHEGSIAYFKELGVWTSEHEVWQAEAVAYETQRIGAWPKAVEEAEAKGLEIAMENKEWIKLWKSYLDEIYQ